jgi:dCMP deaminase
MSWDRYFLGITKAISQNSKCFSQKIGAIIVKDKSIISTGYNGPPRGVPECDTRWTTDESLMKIVATSERNGRCPRHVLGYLSGQGLEYCVAGHGERNAIVNAARMGICVKDATMYCNCPVPCSPCLVEIINSGIKEIVVTPGGMYDITSKYLIKESGIIVREYDKD